MALRTGRYFIHNGTDLVGRNLREKRFLRPKAICNKTNDVEPQWDIEVLRNGRYRMYAKGVPVGIQDGRVVALVLDIKEAEEWRIVQVPGLDRFRIYSSRGDSWVVPRPGQQCEIYLERIVEAEASDTRYVPYYFNFQRVFA